MLELDVVTLTFIAGTIIPLITALLTKFDASSQVKSLVNLLLSIFSGGIAYLIENSGKASYQEVFTAMVAVYLASGVTYQNLWKPTGAANKVAMKSATFGLGKSVPEDIE